MVKGKGGSQMIAKLTRISWSEWWTYCDFYHYAGKRRLCVDVLSEKIRLRIIRELILIKKIDKISEVLITPDHMRVFLQF